jgi:hypothetical protein
MGLYPHRLINHIILLRDSLWAIRFKVLLSWTTPATASEMRAGVARWNRWIPGTGRAKLSWEQSGFGTLHTPFES